MVLFAYGLFIYREMRARDPILPLRLFKKNNFTTANVSGFLLGVSMFGVIIYIPFYLQGVMALSGLYSGTMMMTMTVTLVSASALAGRAISRTGHYKFFGILGIALMVAGMFWMSRLQPDSAALTVYLRLIIFGSGLGISFTISTFAVQLDVGHAHAGLAISSSQLFRQIGGTVGVSLFGKIFTALFAAKIAAIPLPAQLPAAQLLATNPRMLLDSHALAGLSSAVPKEGLSIFFEFVRLCRQSLGESLDTLFFYGCGILLLALAVALFMHEYPLKDESAKSELNPREVA